MIFCVWNGLWAVSNEKKAKYLINKTYDQITLKVIYLKLMLQGSLLILLIVARIFINKQLNYL